MEYSKADNYFRKFRINDFEEKILKIVKESKVTLVCGGVQYGKTLVLPQLLREVGERVIVGVNCRKEESRIVNFINSFGMKRCSERSKKPGIISSLQYTTVGRIRKEIQTGINELEIEKCRSTKRMYIIVLDDVHMKSENQDASFFLLRNLLKRVDILRLVLLTSLPSTHQSISKIRPYFGEKKCQVFDLGGPTSLAKEIDYLEDILNDREVNKFVARNIQKVWNLSFNGPAEERRIPKPQDLHHRNVLDLTLDIIRKIVLQEDQENLKDEPPSYDILVHVSSLQVARVLKRLIYERKDVNFRGDQKSLGYFFDEVIQYGGQKVEGNDLSIFQSLKKGENRRNIILCPSQSSNSVHFPNAKFVIDWGLFAYTRREYRFLLQFSDDVICCQRSNRGSERGVKVFLFQPKDFKPKPLKPEAWFDTQGKALLLEVFGVTRRLVSSREFINSGGPFKRIRRDLVFEFLDHGFVEKGGDGEERITKFGACVATLASFVDFKGALLILRGLSCDLLFETSVLASLHYRGSIFDSEKYEVDEFVKSVWREDSTCDLIACLEIFVRLGIFRFFGGFSETTGIKDQIFEHLRKQKINPAVAQRVCVDVRFLFLRILELIEASLLPTRLGIYYNFDDLRRLTENVELNGEKKRILKSLLHGCFLGNSVVRKSIRMISLPPVCQNPGRTVRILRSVLGGDSPRGIASRRSPLLREKHDMDKFMFGRDGKVYGEPKNVLRFLDGREIGDITNWWTKEGNQAMYVEFEDFESVDLATRHRVKKKSGCPYPHAEGSIQVEYQRLFGVKQISIGSKSCSLSNFVAVEKEEEELRVYSEESVSSDYFQTFVFAKEEVKSRRTGGKYEKKYVTCSTSRFPDLSLIISLLLFAPNIHPCSLIGNLQKEEFVGFKMNDVIVYYDLRSSKVLEEGIVRKIKEFRVRSKRFFEKKKKRRKRKKKMKEDKNSMLGTRELLSSVLKISNKNIKNFKERKKKNWSFFNEKYLRETGEMDNKLILDYLHSLREGETIGVELLEVPLYAGKKFQRHTEVIMLRMSKKIKESSPRHNPRKGGGWAVDVYLGRLIELINRKSPTVCWDEKKRLFVFKKSLEKLQK